MHLNTSFTPIFKLTQAKKKWSFSKGYQEGMYRKLNESSPCKLWHHSFSFSPQQGHLEIFVGEILRNLYMDGQMEVKRLSSKIMWLQIWNSNRIP